MHHNPDEHHLDYLRRTVGLHYAHILRTASVHYDNRNTLGQAAFQDGRAQPRTFRKEYQYRFVTMNKIKDIEEALSQLSTDEKREVLPRFFKTGKGEYGEGDKFLGVTVPNIRQVAKQCKEEPLTTVEELLQSPWHECRMCALLILVEKFKKASSEEKEQIVDLYLQNAVRINNWDLVDLSAPAIIGGWLMDKPRVILYTLASDQLLWRRRIAIVSTLTFIRNRDFADTLRLSEYFLSQPEKMHDLMQKAIGWMLREVGKRDKTTLVAFLDKHSQSMPRTMLRYAIEKFSSEEKLYYMRKN